MSRKTSVALTLAIALVGCRKEKLIDGGPMDPVDAGVLGDAGTIARDGGGGTTTCNNPPIPVPDEGACTVTAGGDAVLLRGDIVTPGGILENGSVLVGSNRKITCAGCDCASEAEAAGATVVACAFGLISPGLINAHDHLTFTEAPPATHGGEVYEHRHDWRRGNNGHTRIPSRSNTGGNRGVSWGELRQLISGTTSINGSGGANGLLRNVDRSGAQQEGLGQPSVEYSTFPLGDIGGETREMGCNYPSFDRPDDADIAGSSAYTPHIAEGIGADARNEFLCLSSMENGGQDLLLSKTGLIHGIGLLPSDYALMAAKGATLVWSPRSNVDLYGHTAQVTLAATVGVRIALGTDWTITGSMNMLRELACADRLNQKNYGSFFDDKELVDMATSNAARSVGADQKIGTLAAGYEADIAIFDTDGRSGYRAIIDGHPRWVVMVMRGGRVLYGDTAILDAVRRDTSGCEDLDVCGRSKKACVMAETGQSISDLRMALRTDAYDLFFCSAPTNEPSCIPFRPGEFMGVPMPGDSDGDGIADDRDNCPSVFNAPRDVDGTQQADADNDMVGDACDRCPLDADTLMCTPPDPNDRDGDRVPNDQDNCPGTANPDQADRDMDNIGDACDQCPDQPNPGGTACVATIYAVKQGNATGRVRLDDVVVTATSAIGYFLQMPTDHPSYDTTLQARFSGVFVFAGSDAKPQIGDIVDVEGMVADFFGQTQLNTSSFTAESSGNALPDPVITTPAQATTDGEDAQAYESVLVEVRDVTVTAINPEPGPGDNAPTNEYVLDGSLIVNDFIYRTDPFPTVGEGISFVRGILRRANGASKLEPRGIGDVGAAPTVRAFEPERVFVSEGSSGVPAGGFAIVLTRSSTASQTVQLTSSSTVVLVPATVEVPAGQTRADVAVTVGVGAGTTEVIVDATLAGNTVQARLQPYSDRDVRVVTAVTLDAALVRPGASTNGRVQLNLPAPTGGTQVYLSVSSSVASVAGGATQVQAGALDAMFVLTASATTGAAILSASTSSVGATATATATFEVSNSVTRAPGAGDLLITEVMYDPNGPQPEAAREWFEVHNATTDTLVLTGINVADSAGPMRGFDVTMSGLSIAPGGYLVFANSADPATNGGITGAIAYGDSSIAFRNSGEPLTLTLGGVTIDTVMWGTGFPGGRGASMCRKFPYAADGTVASSWGTSVGTFGAGDIGSPGVASDATNCP